MIIIAFPPLAGADKDSSDSSISKVIERHFLEPCLRARGQDRGMKRASRGDTCL
jgi:hypothetical protein